MAEPLQQGNANQITADDVKKITRQAIEQQNKRRSRIRLSFTDPRHGLSDEDNAKLDRSYRLDPEKKLGFFNSHFLSNATGLPLNEVRLRQPEIQELYSKKYFGEAIKSEFDFFNRVRDNFLLEEKAAAAAQRSALSTTDSVTSRAKFLEENKDDPVFQGSKDRILKFYDDNFDASSAALGEYRPLIRTATQMLTDQMGVTDGDMGDFEDEDLVRMIMEVDEDKRMSVLKAIGEAAGEGQDKNIFKRIGERFGRSMGDMLRASNANKRQRNIEAAEKVALRGRIDASDFPDELGFDPGSNPEVIKELAKDVMFQSRRIASQSAVGKKLGDFTESLFDVKVPKLGTKEFEALSPSVQETLKRLDEEKKFLDLYHDINQLATQVIDPAEPNTTKEENWAAFYTAKAVLGLSSSTPDLIMMAHPVLRAVNIKTFSDRSTLDIRRSNPGMSASDATQLGTTAGVFQHLLQYIPFQVITGRTPFLGRLLKNPTLTKRRRAANALTRLTVGTTLEFGQEFAQDMAPWVVQAIAAALKKDVPNVNWEEKLSVFASEENLEELIPTIVLMNLIGAGVGSWRDYALTKGLTFSTDVMVASGLTEAEALEVDALQKEGKLDKAQAILRKGLKREEGKKTKTPNTRLADALKLQKKEIDKRSKIIEEGEELGFIPTTIKTQNGWGLRFADESVVEFQTYAELENAREKHLQDKFLDLHEEIKATISQVEKDVEAGRELTYLIKPSERNMLQVVEEGEETRERALNRLDIAKEQTGQSLQNDLETEYNIARNTADLEGMTDDERLANARILGKNVTEFAEGIAKTTSTLYQGFSPITIIEEKSEGDAAVLLEDGKRDWLISKIRAYEKAAKDKVFISGKADQDLTNGDIKEAYSALVQSYFVGRTKKGEVLGRAEKDSEGKAKNARQEYADIMRAGLGSTMGAYAQFFRSVWRRAAKLNRLRREGRLDAELEQELARSVGMSDQAQYERDVLTESEKYRAELEEGGVEPEVEESTSDQSRDEVGFSVVKMSANRLADQKGIPSKIPDDAKGRKFVPIMADRMAGEGTLYGVDLQGGPIYPLINHDKSDPDKITGVWASSLSGVKLILATVKKMGAIFERDGGKYALVAPFAMGPEAHRSNQTFQEAIVARFEEMVSDGMISASQEKAIAKIIKARAESNTLGTDRLRNFPEKFTSKEFKSYMESLSFEERAFISQTLASAEAEKAGAPSATLLMEQARDTSLFGVETGSLISLLEIDIDALEQALSKNDATAERFGVKPHRSYESVIPGRVVTHFRQPIPIEVGAKSLVDDLKVASPNSRVDYLLQGRIPKGITAPSLDQVTIDNINDVQDIPIPRADAVAMAAAMMDEWITLDTKSQKGAKDYIRAIEASEASATLTVYDAKEISKWMRDGYMRVFKLGESDIYFGLLEGEYDAESRTVIDNGEITLVGVVNNTPIKGVLNMIMAKALQEGSNKLDCFAVANDTKPDGLLPTLYGRFGWEVDESFDYDPLYRDDGDTATDAELKKKHQARTQVWKTQGWNESRQGLPPVVFMSHDGVGAEATIVGDSREGVAERQVEEIRANAVGSSGGDVQNGEERTDASRSSGATGGGRRILPRGNDTLVETLRAADSNRLRVLGISEEQRQKVLQAKEFGVSFSVIENAEERIADMFSPFQRSPVLRHEVGARAHKKILDLYAKFRPVFEANRTPKEINEAARKVEEEKLSELLEGISPATVGALELGESIDDVAQRPILAELTSYRTITRKDGKTVRIPTGSLMGKTRAKKEGRSTAEYDDMPEGLPSYVFGGNKSPDQAAQETGFDDVADFWAALDSEIKSFKNQKEAAAAARREVAGISKEAREAGQARKAELLKEKKVVGSDKKTLLGALRMLDAVVTSLPMEIRGKIGGATTIARMSSPRVMLNEIERRVKRAGQELELYLYKQADAALDDTKKGILARIQKTKDTRGGKKYKGRLGQSFYTLVDAAITARNTLTREQGIDEAERVESEANRILEKDSEQLSEEERKLVEETRIGLQLQGEIYRAFSGWRDRDAIQRHHAVKLLNDLYNGAWIVALQEEAKRRERNQLLIAETIESTGVDSGTKERKKRQNKEKGIFAKIKALPENIMNWDGLMNLLFDEELANYFTDAQRKADNDFTDAMMEINEDFDKFASEMIEKDSVKLGKLLTKLAEPTIETSQGTFSEREAIDVILTWNQEDGRRHMEGHKDPETGKPIGSWHYGEAFVKQIKKGLSKNGRILLKYIQRRYAQEYDRYNKLYRKENGVDMPRHKFYAQLSVTPKKGGKSEVIDPQSGQPLNTHMTPSSTRTRGGFIAEPQWHDALDKYFAHKRSMEYWLAYSQFARETNNVLLDRDVQNAILAKSGEEAKKSIGIWTDYFTEGGVRSAGVELGFNKVLRWVTGNFAVMALYGKLTTIAIQTTNLAAANVLMPTTRYLKGLHKLKTGQLDWKDSLKSPYIKRRISELPASVRMGMDALAKAKPSRAKELTEKIGSTIGGADGLSIAGTFVIVYDYRLEKALESGLEGSEAEAFALNEAERLTDRVAQPTRPGARSLLENVSTQQLARTALLFASDPIKNMGLMVRSFKTKDKALIRRSLFFAFIVNGLIVTLVRKAIKDTLDSEDDELFDPKHWSMQRILVDVLTDWMAGIPLFGEEMQRVFGALGGVTHPDGTILSGASGSIYALKNLFDLDDEDDIEDIARDVQNVFEGLGLFNQKARTAAVFLSPVRDTLGFVRNLIDN